MKRLLALVTAATLAALAVGGPVAAAGQRYTQGDADAMLQSYAAAGDEVFWRLYPGLDVRPFDGYDVGAYCVQDWHLIAILWDRAEFSATDGTAQTRDDVVGFLDGLAAEFWLDRQALAMTKTPIKPANDPYFAGAWEQRLTDKYGAGGFTLGQIWATQFGRVIAPGAPLTVGKHTLRAKVTDRAHSVLLDNKMTFTVHDCGGA